MDSQTKDRFLANAETISSAIEELEEFAEEQNYGAFWGKVKEIGSLLRDLSEDLFPHDRQTLRQRFQGIIDNMKRCQTQTSGVVTEALETLSNLGEYKNYEEFRQKSQEITSMFSSLPFDKQEKPSLQEKFRKTKEDTWNKKRDNEKVAAEYISRILDELEVLLQKEDYRAFRDATKEVPSTFKSNPTSREDNQNLWQRYQDMCQKVRDIQQQQRDESERCKKDFWRLISKADIQIKMAETIGDVQEVHDLLEEAWEFTQSMLPRDRHECYSVLNE